MPHRCVFGVGAVIVWLSR